MPLWEHRSTFLLSWVVDLPDNRESFAKADLPRLCKHDSCLTQAGTYPRDPLELILRVCLSWRIPHACFNFLHWSKWPAYLRNLSSPSGCQASKDLTLWVPSYLLSEPGHPLSLLDGDRVLPLCVGYRLLPGTLLREGSQRLPTALQLCCIISSRSLLLISFSPSHGVLILLQWVQLVKLSAL